MLIPIENTNPEKFVFHEDYDRDTRQKYVIYERSICR